MSGFCPARWHWARWSAQRLRPVSDRSGLLISVVANSNKTSLAASLLLLIALLAPTQLPSGLPQGWFSEVLLRLNPVASGLTYVSSSLVGGHPWTQDLSYLISPLLCVALAGGALALAGPRLLQLTPGRSAR
jgi:ABC-2 type transport system permease protein